MADTAFFDRAGPFTASELARLASCEVVGDGSRALADVADIATATPDTVTFLDNPKYAALLPHTRAGACILRPEQQTSAPQGCVLLVTAQPYLAYAMVAQAFYPDAMTGGVIHSSAIIDHTASLAAGCTVEPGAVIGASAELGEGCFIGAGAVIGRGVRIGKRSRIGAQATISHALVGEDVIIHPGVRIGQDGFGFAFAGNRMEKVPQLGRVIIGNHVEIGANSCIDRGAGPDTVIGDYTKIDNLVQIGHNVQIGKACVIVSQVGISGSTQLGDGVVLAGQAGVAGHLKIGSGAKVAAKGGVTKDLPGGQDYGGFPAIPVREWRRQAAMLARMTKTNKGE